MKFAHVLSLLLVAMPFCSASADDSDKDPGPGAALLTVGANQKYGYDRASVGIGLVGFGREDEITSSVRAVGGIDYSPTVGGLGMHVDGAANFSYGAKITDNAAALLEQRLRLKGSADSSDKFGKDLTFRYSQGIGLQGHAGDTAISTGPIAISFDFSGNTQHLGDGCIGVGWFFNAMFEKRVLLDAEHIACMGEVSRPSHKPTSKSGVTLDVLLPHRGYVGGYISDNYRKDVDQELLGSYGIRNNDIQAGLQVGVDIK